MNFQQAILIKHLQEQHYQQYIQYHLRQQQARGGEQSRPPVEQANPDKKPDDDDSESEDNVSESLYILMRISL